MFFSDDQINRFFPISQVLVYPRGTIEVKRRSLISYLDRSNLGGRPEIEKLSKRSLQRLTLAAQEIPVDLLSMITLTYGQHYPTDGREVKQHLKRLLAVLRRVFGVAHYLWFLEFQKRGAPHYHIFVDRLKGTEAERHGLAIAWVSECIRYRAMLGQQGIRGWDANEEVHKMVHVASHHSTWENFREAEGARRYCTKYASKPYQKEVPQNYRNVGRFWGTSIPNDVIKPRRVNMTEGKLREILSNLEHPMAEVPVLPRYIFPTGNFSQMPPQARSEP